MLSILYFNFVFNFILVNDTSKVLRLDTLNPAVLAAEYAVRGAIAIRAEELRQVRLNHKAVVVLFSF